MTLPSAKVCYFQVCFDGHPEARAYESCKDAILRVMEKMIQDGGAWCHDEEAVKDGVECSGTRFKTAAATTPTTLTRYMFAASSLSLAPAIVDGAESIGSYSDGHFN